MAGIDPRQPQLSLEEMFNDAKRRIQVGEFNPEEIDILNAIFTERGFEGLLPETPLIQAPETLAQERIDSLMSSTFGEEQAVQEELPAEPISPVEPVATLPIDIQIDRPEVPLAVAEPESTLPIKQTELKPFIGGVIKEEDIPVFLRKAYNNSIVGMAETIASGEPPFDLSGMETSQLEDIASTIAGFLMPVDLLTFLGGGGIGGLVIKGALKQTVLKSLMKKTTEKLVKSGLSKQLAETTAIKGVNNIVQRLGGKTVIAVTAEEIAKKATIGGTALGIFESARGALADKIEKDEVRVSDVLGHFGSGFTLGATAAVGGTAGKALGAVGGKITAFIGELGGEVVSFGTIGAAMEGRTPTKDDYLNAAGVIIGMRAARLAGKATKGLVKGVAKSIESSVKEGIKFREAVERASKDERFFKDFETKRATEEETAKTIAAEKGQKELRTPEEITAGVEKVIPAPKEKPLEISRKKSLVDVPIEKISKETDTFQNRESEFSQETVDRIVKAGEEGTFDFADFDPVILWKEPQTGNLFVIAGHSRLEAFKRLKEKGIEGFEEVPSTIIEGTKEQAREKAIKSNILASKETDIERANFYRELREKGVPKKEIAEQAKSNEGKNSPTIIALSFLKKDGPTIEAIRRLQGGSEVESRNIISIGKWIGFIRSKHPELKTGHEKEMLNLLLNEFGKKFKSLTSFEEFVEKVIDRQTTLGEFDDKPFNFERIKPQTGAEANFLRQISEKETELKQAKRIIDKKRKEFTEREVTKEEIQKALVVEEQDIIAIERELLDLKSKKSQVISKIRKGQTALKFAEKKVPISKVSKAKETPPERDLPLKTASQEEASAKAQELGVEFAGIMGEGVEGVEPLMLFTDPKTKSTIAVKNLGELESKLKESREKFGIKEEKEDGITRTQKTEEPEIKPEVGTEEVSETPKAEEVVTNKAFKALQEGGIESSEFPKYSRSINLERQNVSDKIKNFEIEVGKLKPKKVQTWDETGELSKEILKDYKKSVKVLKKAKQGKALNTEEIDAARQINIDSINKLKELAETGGVEEFTKSFEQYVEDVFMPLSDASSEAGRALNIHKKSVSMNQIARSFAKLERGLNERELKQFKILDLENPKAVKKFIDEIGDPRLRDYMYQFWYNSILSGIPTHLVNVISNTGWAIFQVPHRGLTAGVDAMITKFTGKKRTRYLKEMVPMLSGHKNAFFKGAKRAKELIRTNEITEFDSKWSMDIGTRSLSAFERSPYKPLRAIAPLLSAPTRALRAMDVWANSMAFDAQLNALARREGLNNGLKGEALKQFEKDLLNNPSDKMLTDAALFARHSTFMDEPGKFTQWILKGRDITPGGRFVIPFVNTISNLFKRGIELTPGLGLTLARNRPIAEVIANQIEGSILGLYILKLADEDRITGAAPTNKTEREAFFRQGKLPWAIKFGDTYYSYRRIEPFNTVISSVAIAHDKITNAKDDETATEIFGNMVEALLENLIDSSYFNGLTNLIDRFGRRTGMFQRHLASFVPYSSFWRSINRSYEVATGGETKVRETKSLLGAFSQVIPGMSDKVPARLNVWGEEIILPGGILRQWLPYKSSEIKDDPVEVELERLTIYPGIPSQTVTINREKIEFPDDFYRNYVLDFGRITKSEILRIINLPEYRKLSDAGKRILLDRRITQFRTAARNAAKIRFLKISK